MRLLCLHADTIRALASLHAPFDDLTPDGLWGTDYHLVGVTADQRDVLRTFGIDLEDVTPAQLEIGGRSEGMRSPVTPRITPPARPGRMDQTMSREPMRPREPAPVSREPVRDPGRVPETRADSDAGRDTSGGAQDRSIVQSNTPQPSSQSASQPSGQQSIAASAQAGPSSQAASSAAPAAPPQAPKAAPPAGSTPAVAASNRPAAGGVATRAPMRLRTRLKGKYREAFVQDGKIMLDGQKFDSPLHASKSLAPDKKDWELWEYYDDDAGKWYMLDREWETA